jgi:hypothetical protein
MPKDTLQIVQGVLRSVLAPPSDGKRSTGLSTGRAVLLGAGLFTAGRLTAGHGGGGLVESLQNRLEATLGDHDADDEEPEDYEDEEDVDDEELEDEPVDEEG